MHILGGGAGVRACTTPTAEAKAVCTARQEAVDKKGKQSKRKSSVGSAPVPVPKRATIEAGFTKQHKAGLEQKIIECLAVCHLPSALVSHPAFRDMLQAAYRAGGNTLVLPGRHAFEHQGRAFVEGTTAAKMELTMEQTIGPQINRPPSAFKRLTRAQKNDLPRADRPRFR